MTTDNAGFPPPAEPPAKNTFQRIAGVLFAPAETFKDIARKPDILVPLLILIVIGFIVTALIVPRMDFATSKWGTVRVFEAGAGAAPGPDGDFWV